MQHACTADQCGAQELFFFIKLPSNFIFFLFSGFTFNTGWQAATERENALSTYVCTLFPCITRRIFYRRMCCYHARSLLHTFHARRYFLFRASSYTRPASHFMHFSRTHRLHLVLHTCICFHVHTHSHMCIAKICPYKQTNLHIYSGTREQSTFASFICWPKRQHVHQIAALKLLQFVC